MNFKNTMPGQRSQIPKANTIRVYLYKIPDKANQSTGSTGLRSTSAVACGGGCQGWVGGMICQGTKEHFGIYGFLTILGFESF